MKAHNKIFASSFKEKVAKFRGFYLHIKAFYVHKVRADTYNPFPCPEAIFTMASFYHKCQDRLGFGSFVQIAAVLGL